MREKQRGFSGVVAFIALIIAIIALILAWVAYERTGADLDQRIKDAADTSVNGIQQGVEGAADAIDKGPDGVDRDDTDTNTGTAQ